MYRFDCVHWGEICSPKNAHCQGCPFCVSAEWCEHDEE
ncbi:hypothetical protein MTAT_20210 [Moorella thermoacetica]|uniref:Uncharacterized protein n=1 Tax=Neomoorella thermoacetica TaxID=1525 RepID=A0AAC9MVI0_NEOTH|nr:hypothetical protein Maut_02248 [Moorella thermoacetica]TYL12779.1 hypothetical protein MTAT_20210 [Moorella thermoacetica]